MIHHNSDLTLLFSLSRLSLVAKLSIFTTNHNTLSPHAALFCFVFSQVQIFSIFLKTTLFSFTPTHSTLYDILNFFHIVVTFGDPLSSSESSNFPSASFVISYAYLIFAIILFIHLFGAIIKKGVPQQSFQKIWNYLICFHLRIFFYPICSVSVQAIKIAFSTDQSQYFSNDRIQTAIQVLSCILILFNLIISAIMILISFVPIKTSSPISCKTNVLNISEFILKVVYPVLWVFGPDLEAYKISLLVVNILFCLFRDGIFFKILPYYNLTVLRINLKFNAAKTMLALVSLIYKVIPYVSSEEGLLFTSVTWIILVFFIIQAYSTQLEKILTRILFFSFKTTSPYKTIHYPQIYADFINNIRQPSSWTKRFYKNNLLNLAFKVQMLHNFSSKDKENNEIRTVKADIENSTEGSIPSKSEILELLKTSLESASKRYPANFLPTIMLANCYINCDKSYQLANQIIEEGVESNASLDKIVSFSLMRLKLMRKLRRDKISKMQIEGKISRNGRDINFNMSAYLGLHEKFQRLKSDIKDQITPQINFWKDFQGTNPDLGSLIESVNMQNNNKSRRIEQEIVNYRDYVKAHFFEPILIFGLYLSFVHNDIRRGQKLIKEYEKLKLEISVDISSHYNMIINSFYFKVSANLKELGRILSYSRNKDNIFHNQNKSLVGKPINFLAPVFDRETKDHILGIPIKEITHNSMDKLVEINAVDAEGYLASCWMSFSLDFLPKIGLSYFILLKPIEDSNKLFVRENGDLLHFSRRFANDMNIDNKAIKSMINIVSFCPEMRIILAAFQNTWQSKTSARPELKLAKHSSSISHCDEEEGGFDSKENIQSNLERLYHKYLSGDILVFQPQSISNRKKETVSIISHGTTDDYSKKAIVYSVTIQRSPYENETIVEIELKKLDYMNVEEARRNLDEFLRKPSPQTLTQKTMFSTNPTMRRLSRKSTLITKPRSTWNKTITIPDSISLKKENSLNMESPKHETIDSQRFDSLTLRSPREENRKLLALSPQSSPLSIEKLQNRKTEYVFDQEMKSDSHRAGQKGENEGYRRASLALFGLEDNFAKSKMAKKQYDDTTNRTSNFSKILKVEKILQRVLQSKKRTQSSLGFLLYCILTGLLVIAVLIWLGFNASAVSQQVDVISGVLLNIYLRSFWTNLANQESRLWAGVRGGLIDLPGIVDATVETMTTNLTFHNMDLYNTRLLQSVGQVDLSLQKLMLEKNVRVFIRDENNNLELVAVDTSFQVTTDIVSNGFMNVYMPPVSAPIEDYINEESRFIFDNSHNDLLIASETLIQAFTDTMDNSFDNAQKTSLGLFCFGIIVVLLYFAGSLFFVFVFNKQANQFMDILFTLPPQEVLKIEHMLWTFQNLLDKDYEGFQCIEALEAAQTSKMILAQSSWDTETNLKSQRQTIRKPSTVKLARQNLFLSIRSIVAQLAILSCIIAYFFWSEDRIQAMKTQQHSISSALTNINLQSRFSLQLQALVLDNMTSTIRNVPVLESLNVDIAKLQEINALEDTFNNANGELPERLQEIFINFNCSESYSNMYLLDADVTIDECYTVFESLGTPGLIKILLETHFQLTSFLGQFEASPRDIASLHALYTELVSTFIEYIDVATTFFILIYDYTQEGFDNLVSDSKIKGYILAVLAICLGTIVGFLCWVYSVRPLANREYDYKRVLLVVPTKLVMSSIHIKSYIIRTAGGKIDLTAYFSN